MTHIEGGEEGFVLLCLPLNLPVPLLQLSTACFEWGCPDLSHRSALLYLYGYYTVLDGGNSQARALLKAQCAQPPSLRPMTGVLRTICSTCTALAQTASQISRISPCLSYALNCSRRAICL